MRQCNAFDGRMQRFATALGIKRSEGTHPKCIQHDKQNQYYKHGHCYDDWFTTVAVGIAAGDADGFGRAWVAGCTGLTQPGFVSKTKISGTYIFTGSVFTAGTCQWIQTFSKYTACFDVTVFFGDFPPAWFGSKVVPGDWTGTIATTGMWGKRKKRWVQKYWTKN